MPYTSNYRGIFLSLPRDHFRRKRAIRRIGNITFIIVFSLVVAYVLTRPVGGGGFSLPKTTNSTPAQSPPVVKK
jgi:hypothetical protein